VPVVRPFHILAGVALVLLSPASGLSGTPPSFDFSRRAGLYDATARDSVWIQIADSTLAAGDTLTVLTNVEVSPRSPEEAESPRFTTAVVDRRLGRNTARDLLEGLEESTYLLRIADLESVAWTIGLVVVAPPAAFWARDGHLESDVDADGLIERYSECTSIEGVHFEIWEGRAPFQGESIVDFYYYVPYDLEPTCPGIDPSPRE